MGYDVPTIFAPATLAGSCRGGARPFDLQWKADRRLRREKTFVKGKRWLTPHWKHDDVQHPFGTAKGHLDFPPRFKCSRYSLFPLLTNISFRVYLATHCRGRYGGRRFRLLSLALAAIFDVALERPCGLYVRSFEQAETLEQTRTQF